MTKESLEEKITTRELIGGLAKGIIPSLLSGVGAYAVTQGIGWPAACVAASSLGMYGFTEDDEGRVNEVAKLCYKIGMVSGFLVTVLALGDYLVHNHKQP